MSEELKFGKISDEGKSPAASGLEDLIMGIDLGTTNSAVAVYTDSMVPTLCPLNAEGKVTMPSCVRWDRPEMDGCKPWTVGEEAYQERFMPDVCYSIKRVMGSGTKFRFVDRNNSKHVLDMTPAEISSLILGELKSRVNKSYPGLRRCIITVPAYFNQRQIEDTIEAANLADLECVQILKEPTSASYIYSQLGYATDGSIMVYDLGGGTFDVTIMSFLRKSTIPDKMYNSLKRQYGIDFSEDDGDSSLYFCRVLGTYGDVNLGGDDIDAEMVRLVLEDQPELNLSEIEQEELKLKCEMFKKSGIEGLDTTIGDKSVKIRADHLNRAVDMVFQKTMDIIDQIPEVDVEQARTIVLVGGSTKSEQLTKRLSERFPNKEISRILDPDATVALGAGAVAKDIMEGRGCVYQDVLPMMIGVLRDESTVDVLVPKNTAIPFSVNRTYYTMYDNQPAVSIGVYQGVSTKPEECTFLGTLRIDNLPQRPAGEVTIKVYMLLNAQGRLRVSTVIDGKQVERELVIDSIFSVSDSNAIGDSGEVFTFDEFEEGLADIAAKSERIKKLLLERREAIKAGNEGKVSTLEAKIVESI